MSAKFNPFATILQFLDQYQAKYELLDHEPVFTSAQAQQIRGLEGVIGAKALLIKTNLGYFLVVMPGTERLDSKKLKAHLGCKKLRFATPEEVVEIMGCEIGACYPLGPVCKTPMVVEASLAQAKRIAFNPGRHNRSVIMAWSEYERLLTPELVDLRQSP